MAWNDNLTPGTPAHNIAVSAHNRIRVLAGPGAGKSFAMQRRVARLLEAEAVDPSRILAVTFTRVAAEDLHRSLVSLDVPGAEQLRGRTLHSLAMEILMRNHVLRVLGRTPRPLNEFELEPLLSDLRAVHGNKHKRRSLIRAYGAAWARLQTQEPGFTRTPEEQAFADELVAWLTWHEAMLMDEVIPHLYQYLRANPGAPERNEYLHVLIDEYQDLNRAEQDVLQLLGATCSICIVGDDDQSIYSFRYAHPDGIRQWIDRHPSDEHSIAACWRCPTTIVAMANALIARNRDRLGTTIAPSQRNGVGEIVVRQYRTAAAEADAVAQKIEDLIAAEIPPGEIIVLAQRQTFADPVFQNLRHRGIPTKSYYAETELDTGEAQRRFALLKLLLNNEDRVALRWLLGYGRTDWHAAAYQQLTERAQEDGTSPWRTLEALAEQRVAVPQTAALIARFRDIRTELAALEALADDVDGFLAMWLPASPDTALLADAVNRCRGEAASPAELYDALYEAITRPEIPLAVPEVRIMSLHKSKGLSSPYVFIVGCVEGLLPAQPDRRMTAAQRAAKLEEDRRLFYVGITRVKCTLPQRPGYLALTYPQTMRAADAHASQIAPVRTQNGIAFLQPSRFLTEMMAHLPAAQFNAPL
jgi:DNA helicase II / ATP-dependent DNA helicase PcrA